MKLAAALMAALLLGLVASVYFVAVAATLPKNQTTTNKLVTYGGSTDFTYRATIKPNALYNQTTLLPGGGTLFVTMVRTLNLSFTYLLNLSAASTVSLEIGESLTVGSSTWNLTLNHSHQGFSPPTTASSLAVRDSLVMNLTAVLRQIGAVNNATGYVPTSYVFHYRAIVLATITASGASSGFVINPSLNLTMLAGSLTPGNFTTQNGGSVTSTTTGPDPSTTFYQDLSYATIAVVVAASAALGYHLLRPSSRARRPVDEESVIEEMTIPYKDAISSTLSLPHKENIVVMRTWDDLVHAADMLSKPVLHLTNRVEGRMRHIFYVVDGAVQYVYIHGVMRQSEGEAPATPEPPGPPNAPPTAPPSTGSAPISTPEGDMAKDAPDPEDLVS